MSNKLMTALSSSPVDLGVLVGLTPVCIDNENIRQRILKDKKLEITSVPCVLIVYSAGTVEKYEGIHAFEWIEETIIKYTPQQSHPQQSPHQQSPHQQSHPQQSPHQKSPPQQSHQKSPPQQQYPQRSQEQPPIRQPPQQRKVQIRPPDDYVEEESEEEYIPEPPRRKKQAVQKRVKKETTMEELGIEIDISEDHHNSEFDGSGEKQTAASLKAKDLMSAAMAMQKERDSVDSGKSKNNNANLITNKRPI